LVQRGFDAVDYTAPNAVGGGAAAELLAGDALDQP
jgi:hypothetical protein